MTRTVNKQIKIKGLREEKIDYIMRCDSCTSLTTH